MSDLPAVGYPDRADRVRARFDEPALLVTNLTNVRWLTGFTGSNGWVVVLPDRLVLGTDGRYRDRAEAELADAGVDAEILTGFTRAEQHEQLIGTLRGIPQVGAEAATLTHAAWTSLAAEIDIVPSDGHVEAERRVKTSARSPASPRPPASPMARAAVVAPLLGDVPHRGRHPRRARSQDAPPRRRRPELRHDRRIRPRQRRPAAPRARDAAHRGG